MTFSEYSIAARTRDLFVSICEKTINQMRPEPRPAVVVSYNSATLTAEVQFAGDTGTVRVKLARNQIPTSSEEQLVGSTANIVRVAGRPGQYYILNYLSGESQSEIPPGVVLEYGGDTAPPGYLMANGNFVSKVTYSRVFAAYGHKFNSGVDPGDGTFKLPNRIDCFARGANPTVGVTGGSATKTLSVANMPAHNHGSAGSHGHNTDKSNTSGSSTVVWQAGVTGDAIAANGMVKSDGAHTHTTQGSGTAFDVMNPYLTMNFIIKT